MNPQDTTNLPLRTVDLETGWIERVVIRHVREEDLASLEWDGEYSRYRRVYANVFKRAQKGLAVLWVADLPGRGLIGQVFVQLNSIGRPELADGKRRAYVHSVRVRSYLRGGGLGSLLMQVAETDLQERGFRTVTLNVGLRNRGARHLYSRLGYRVVAPDPGRWSYVDENGVVQHVNDPGWWMQKDLD
jgi:ribosomal protein S18 acetylase RimI-like enzyme